MYRTLEAYVFEHHELLEEEGELTLHELPDGLHVLLLLLRELLLVANTCSTSSARTRTWPACCRSSWSSVSGCGYSAGSVAFGCPLKLKRPLVRVAAKPICPLAVRQKLAPPDSLREHNRSRGHTLYFFTKCTIIKSNRNVFVCFHKEACKKRGQTDCAMRSEIIPRTLLHGLYTCEKKTEAPYYSSHALRFDDNMHYLIQMTSYCSFE